MLTVEQINQINSVLGNDKLLNKINGKIASLKKQMKESIEDHSKDLEQAEEALEAAISDANSYGKECYHDLIHAAEEYDDVLRDIRNGKAYYLNKIDLLETLLED
jgi:hypothetical protein